MINGQYKVKEKDVDERIDKFLSDVIRDMSRSQLKKEIEGGSVLVNDKTVKGNYRLKDGDLITWEITEDEGEPLYPVALDLKVLFEDDDLAVIFKPRDLTVHPGHGMDEVTLAHGLMAQFNELSDANGEERPGIVHRLDKDTAGLLVIAKNNDTHKALQTSFREATVYREYEAIVKGRVDEKGIIEKPIGRHPVQRVKMAVVEDGRESLTLYEPIQALQGATVLKVEIRTGRTHQIRVHLSAIGHPIVGDTTYGGREKNISTPLLFAKKIGFHHPITGDWLVFEGQRPRDMEIYIERNLYKH